MSNAIYRADIDGLRAIAVISVVLYHFGLLGFSGGYVGVDIFFTISGYLIGSIVFKQLGQKKFSFTTFYARRIRRLLPAYLATIIVSTGLAYWLLLPGDFREFGQSIVSATLYVSNIYFYLNTGYFDTASHLKPLLHTWSLAVEEQFYLIFPLLAWIGFRFSKKAATGLFLTLCLLSFSAALYFIKHDQSAAFYLYPLRAWEMFIGVLLAATAPRALSNSKLNSSLAFTGLALLVLPIVFYDQATLFPGIAALPPCIGTLLIIYTGEQSNNITKSLLSTKPFVFFGKISYSLYLWHWPIVVFYTYSLEQKLTTIDSTILFIITVAISTLSWLYIETPFRVNKSQWVNNNRSILTLTLFSSILCAGLGYAIHATNGLPSRLSPELQKLATLADGFNSDWENCFTQDNEFFPGLEHCKAGNPESSGNILLVWGDSHSLSLKSGLLDIARKYHQDVLIVWRGGCPPVFDIEKRESSSSLLEDKKCRQQNDVVRKLVDSNDGIKAVTLVGRWSYYINGGGTGVDKHNTISITPVTEHKPGHSENNEKLFLFALQNTLTTLNNAGKKVFLVEQPPEFSGYHSRILAKKLMMEGGRFEDQIKPFTHLNYDDLIHRQRPMIQFLKGTNKLAVNTLPTHQYFCNTNNCSILIDGKPAYYDNNHISASASKSIQQLFEPVMAYLNLAQQK